MASKGAHAEGTDGSDYTFRQSVEAVYQQTPYFKSRLSLVSRVHTLMVVVVATTAVVFSKDPFPFHPALLLSLLLPLLALRGMKSNSVAVLTIYSVLSALVSAYLLIIGVGRHLDLASLQGYTPYHISFILLNFVTVLSFLTGSFYARRLINLWREAAFQRELRSIRRGGPDGAGSKKNE